MPCKYTPPKNSRTFNGKKYKLGRTRTSKRSADKLAETYRERGRLARVVEGKDARGKKTYLIYIK